ncbi:uncharacterized protein METZ01_LOCUS474211 [marine metagenome]|uniref:ABM domain-containing protein n=1 Tax=marine metagenome TaxID=408172 RepID=A0A383BMJ4_9ZZZZ
MLYNVCKLKEHHSFDEVELAIGETCSLTKAMDGFIAGQVVKYAGFVSEEGTVGDPRNTGVVGNHFGLITYWKSFDDHEKSHKDAAIKKAFEEVLEVCEQTYELGYEIEWQGEKET